MSMGYVPEHTHDALMNYFLRAWEPGSFLMSVLTNDLMGAAGRADSENRKHLAEIATWVCHNAPYGSWGTGDAVQGWLNKNEYQQEYVKQHFMNTLSGSNV